MLQDCRHSQETGPAMTPLKVLLLLLGLGVSVNSDVSLQKRIIGGNDCDNNKRQYHVRITADGQYVCGGSLIRSQWILTAFHCWLGNKGSTMGAMLKVHPRTQQGNQIIPVSPVFYPQTNRRHDILLLKLQTPVIDINPVPQPDCMNRPAIGNMVELAGEGPTRADPNNRHLISATIPPHLQCVDMKVDAVSVDSPTRGYIFHVLQTGKDACHGDSGGGVLFNDKIYGVISGIGKYACDIPVRIMDVCEYWDWIEAETAVH